MHHRHDEGPRNDLAPTEGLFDAQLRFLEPIPAIATIIKRDGRSVAFDTAKIARAIHAAAVAAGDADRIRGDELAKAVALYLAKRPDAASVTATDVRNAIERVLVEMGHVKAALAFARAYQKRPPRTPDAPSISEFVPTASPHGAGAPFSLADAGRIIRGSAENNISAPLDPVETDRLLAERVKAEFALTHVFSHTTAEAHARGELRLGDLGRVDRLERTDAPLERIKRLGIPPRAGLAAAGPPRRPDELIAQMAVFTTALWRHFTGPVRWPAFNVYFAPLVTDLDHAVLKDLARVLLHEFAYCTARAGPLGRPTLLGLSWATPTDLAAVEAIGPGGEYTGATYDELAQTARALCWALIEVYEELGDRQSTLPVPRPEFTIGPATFAAREHRAFVDRIAGLAATRGDLHVCFEREDPLLPYAAELFRLTRCVAHSVTIRLGQSALAASDHAVVRAEWDRLADAAIRAHLEKRAFLDQLLAMRDAGPFSFLTDTGPAGPLLDPRAAVFAVNIDGAAPLLSCAPNGESGAVMVVDILNHLRDRLIHTGETDDMIIRLGNDATSSAGATPTPVDPLDRLKEDSRLHPWFEAGAEVRIHARDSAMSQESAARLIDFAFFHTPCRAIRFDR